MTERGQAERSADKSEIAEIANGEERFRLLVDSVKDYAILMLDPRGVVTTWNKGAERIKGYSAGEIIGRHFSQLFSQEDVAQGKPQHQLAVAVAEGRFGDAGWRIRKDGTRFWAEVVITPIYGNDGKLSGFGKVTRDASASRKAEQKFKDLLEAAPDAIIIVNQSWKVIFVNAQAEKLFGYTRDEIIGHAFEELLPTHLHAGHRLRREQFLVTPNVRPKLDGVNICGLRKNGTEFPFEFGLNLLQTEEGMVVLCAIHDITERKQYERTLQEKNIQLQAAVNELDAFSYSVSHDLRTPLRAIDGFSRILLKYHAAELTPEPREYLQAVHDNTVQMGHLVDDLLAFARVNRTQISKREVPTRSLVDQVLRELQQRTDARRVAVSVGELPAVWGDPALLKQVFVNLIDNAFKYSSKRDDAAIEIGTRDIDGEQVFFVRDNGVGFDMQYADQLFGVFQRLHRAEDFEGTGVGLAIVQRIIQRHGGRIWAEAAVDQGATFYFTTGIPNHA
jgi:PAS domain S-box-containing protein